MTRAWWVLALLLTPALAQASEPSDPAGRVATFLANSQNPDGSFRLSGYILEGIAGLPIDAKSWPSREKNLYDALEPFAGLPNDPFGPYKGKVRLAYQLATAGYDPRAWDEDLVAAVWAGYLGGQFGDPRTINDDTFALMALRAAGERVDERMTTAGNNLLSARNADGGWSIDPKGLSKSDVEDTAYALAALRAAGILTGADARAKTFLDSARVAGGGFATAPGGTANCQSTAWGIQARWLLGGYDASADTAFLLGLQQADGGVSIGTGPSDVFCSAEALVVFSNDFLPRAAYAPCPVTGTDARALAPATLSVPAKFGDATWIIGSEKRHGATPDYTPPQRGALPFFVLAEGSGSRCRASGTLAVQSALPVVVAPERVEALRRVPVEIDLGASYDPDGRVVDQRTTLPPDATFAFPGNYSVSVSVLDDAGEWSLPATVLVHVANRAPILSNLPARVTGDRLGAIEFNPVAHDADGDIVTIEGPLELRSETLGARTVTFTARDGYDGVATREVVVDIVNIPPTLTNLTADSVDARDPDGPAPAVAWFVDGAPRTTARLPPGQHSIQVIATDADNATTTLFANVTVPADDAPPVVVAEPARAEVRPEPAPRLATPEFDLAPSIALVGVPVDLVLRAVESARSYRFVFGDGNATEWGPGTAESHAWATPGAYELQAFARSEDGRTSMTTLVITVREPKPPTPDEAPRPTVLEQTASPVTTEEPRQEEATPAQTQESRREAPALGLLGALVCVALGTLARRASTRTRK